MKFFCCQIFFLLALCCNAQEYISNVQHFGLEEGLKSRSIQKILKDKRGVLWLSGGSGLTRFDGRDFLHFTAGDGQIPFQGIRFMIEDPEGWLWLLNPCKNQTNCKGKLAFFNPITFQVLSVEERFKTDFPLNPNDLTSLKTDEAKNVYFNSKEGTFKWSEKEGFQKSENQPNSHLLGKLTYHSPFDSSIWNFNPKQYTITHPTKGFIYDLKENHPEFNQNIKTTHLFFDEFGTAWIGTIYGLFCIQLKKKKFHSVLTNPLDNIISSESKNIHNIIELPDETMLYSTSEGIYQVQNGKPELLSIDVMKAPPIFMKSFVDNQLWMANKFGLYKMDLVENSVSFEAFDQKALFEQVFTLSKIEKDKLWLGTDKGVHIFDLTTHEIEALPIPPKFEKLKKSAVYHFFHNGGDIWISTILGLYQYKKQASIIERFDFYKKGNDSPVEEIYNVFKAKDGSTWVGTRSGLVKWTLGSKDYNFFYKSGKMIIGRVYSIQEDNKGNFWWSTRKDGIIQFLRKEETTKRYDVQDGLPFFNFNINSSWKTKTGNLHFGSMNGTVVIKPEQFGKITDQQAVDLIVLDYEQFSKETNIQSYKTAELIENKQITIRPQDGIFNLKVSLTDYSNATLFKYAYKIDALGNTWHESWDNTIHISGLPYGNHTLTIQGKLATGQFSTKKIEIPIRVLKPVYLQTWFIFLLISLSIASGFLLYKRRTNQLKRQQAKLEKMVQERTATIEQQKEKLQNLDKTKSRFFANVSHELRTPLTLLLGPISSAIKSNTLDNRNFTYLKIAQQNGQSLLRLVNEILDLTKLEFNKMELQEAPTALFPLLQRLCAAFESYAEKEAIIFIQNFQIDPYLQLLLDHNKFEKILNNLLSNAFKFTPSKGTITVNILDLGNRIQLSVQDNGRGIHPNDVAHVFDRYYQTSQPDALTEGGTGIGLALCKEFSKLMNGKIWLESELDKGSVFYYEFPKKQVLGFSNEALNFDLKENQEEGEEKVSLNPIRKKQVPLENELTLLVVEDNRSLRDYLQAILSEKYNVIVAENGKVGLDRLKEGITKQTSAKSNQQPSLIISDIMMPVMDGFQFLEKVKSSEQFRHLPMIMLTARAELQDKLKALRIGVDDYLIKPFEEEELFARIENLLKNSNERQLAVGSPSIGNIQVTVHEVAQPNIPTNADSLTEKRQVITSEDLEWLETLEQLVQENLERFNLTIDDLANKMAMSRRKFYYRVKKLTGLTPNEYLLEIRFNKARTMLESGTHQTVKSIIYSVGFKDTAYFSKQFKKRFGKLPSTYFNS